MLDPQKARRIVLERYPEAYCEDSGRGLYLIVSTRYRGYVLLSQDVGQSSEAEAWLDAARRIERDKAVANV